MPLVTVNNPMPMSRLSLRMALPAALLLLNGCFEANVLRNACANPPFLQAVGDSCYLFAPAIITPNADGFNDVFGVELPDCVSYTDFSLEIFNGRQQVWGTTNPGDRWNAATRNGRVYVGSLRYELRITLATGLIQHSGLVYSLPYEPDRPEKYALVNCRDCVFSDQHDPASGLLRESQDPILEYCE